MNVFLLLATLATNPTPHPELGVVEWRRDFERAKAEASRENRPLLVLFDEVPGCSTVRGYGARVLSHPLIKEAMETLFVPTAVFNNVGGDDRRVLNRFNEPTWNNPAVRIVDQSGNLLAPRLYGDYSVEATAQVMVIALKAQNRDVPEYLRLLASGSKTETATFAMYCFWSGEVAFGGVDGVVRTTPGFSGGEVVRVDYDPARVSREELERVAASAKARRVSNQAFKRSAKDNKYQLAHSLLRFVPLTESQASRVNSALGRRSDALVFLSPSQREIYRAVKRESGRGWPLAIGQSDFGAAFAAASQRARMALAER